MFQFKNKNNNERIGTIFCNVYENNFNTHSNITQGFFYKNFLLNMQNIKGEEKHIDEKLLRSVLYNEIEQSQFFVYEEELSNSSFIVYICRYKNYYWNGNHNV